MFVGEWIFILAQRAKDDDGGGGNVVFFLVVFLFMAIGSLVSWLNKKSEQERRRRAREAIARNQATMRLDEMMSTVPRPAATRVQRQHGQIRSESREERIRRLQQMVSPRSAQKPAPPKRAVASLRRPVAPPPPPPPPAPAVLQTQATAPPSVAQPAPQVARAQQIAQWLKPQTLRSQFILTELLQPPLALREPRDFDVFSSRRRLRRG